jgi:hypothetical protein|tara:strand:+ start:2182 stop:2388 length:207 start_codon:yes stop_codon:yes gene_type:complete
MIKGNEQHAFQSDPMAVTAEPVRYWGWNGLLKERGMSRDDAREAVRQGQAFVLNKETIREYESRERPS